MLQLLLTFTGEALVLQVGTAQSELMEMLTNATEVL